MMNCNGLSYSEAMALYYAVFEKHAFTIIITKNYGIFDQICKN